MTGTTESAPALSRPWLSILIPAYNVELYLQECLASILKQTDDNVQIILCDDCSTDRTKSIAEHFLTENPLRIQIIENESNKGISATRNTLLDHAEGDYIWFIDSDDTMRPGAIAAVRQWVERASPDIISGDYHKGKLRKFAFGGLRGQMVYDSASIISGICRSRKMYLWIRIFHKRLWDTGLRFPERKVFEDAALLPWLGLRAQSLVHLNQSLVNYRIRTGSILAETIRSPAKFDTDRHFDLAHALDGFSEALDKADDGKFGEARFAVSHFIAMEFSKIVQRIVRAGPVGCGVDDIHALARQFQSVMNEASPLPFADLRAKYLRRGRLISWFKLHKALRQTQI